MNSIRGHGKSLAISAATAALTQCAAVKAEDKGERLVIIDETEDSWDKDFKKYMKTLKSRPTDEFNFGGKKPAGSYEAKLRERERQRRLGK
jgi:hypothetical protein